MGFGYGWSHMNKPHNKNTSTAGRPRIHRPQVYTTKYKETHACVCPARIDREGAFPCPVRVCSALLMPCSGAILVFWVLGLGAGGSLGGGGGWSSHRSTRRDDDLVLSDIVIIQKPTPEPPPKPCFLTLCIAGSKSPRISVLDI